MQRHNRVLTGILAARKANISNHTNYSSSRNECVETLAPYCVKLPKKLLVVFDVTELSVGPFVFL
jgi:hypothetical protein